MRKLLAASVSVAALALSVIEATAVEPRGTEVRQRSRVVIGAAGDIACASDPLGSAYPATCQYDDTADLIKGTGLSEVLLLGDNQYETGAYAAYTNYFDPTWGRAFPILSPAPGNHEYGNDVGSTPHGYFRYFGKKVKGPDGLGYYSFDLGACPDAPCWHLISLSSELCFAAGGCGPAADPSNPGPGNRMYTWLQRDLNEHPDATYPCTLAYWHHPRFSFSTGSGATTAVGPLWKLLYRARADLVLSGHSHNYQRWEPQDPAGKLNVDRGIREFVVGTGGKSHYALPAGARPDNLAAAQADAFGILRLTLRESSYRWKWVSAAGQPSFDDASKDAMPCVRAGP